MDIKKISSKFKHLMKKGNVNGALTLFTNNTSNAILPLANKTLKLLQTKYPKTKIPNTEALLQGPKKPDAQCSFWWYRWRT